MPTQILSAHADSRKPLIISDAAAHTVIECVYRLADSLLASRGIDIDDQEASMAVLRDAAVMVGVDLGALSQTLNRLDEEAETVRQLASAFMLKARTFSESFGHALQ